MKRGKPYGIVVGVDGAELGNQAVVQAFELARDRDDAELHAVHAVTDDELEDAPGRDRLERQNALLQTLPHATWERLERLARGMHQPPGQLRVTVHVRFGAPAETLHQVAIDYDADIIVVGTHGRRGMERLILGSVAEALVRTARCPVLIARPKNFEGLAKTERVQPPPERPSRPPKEPHQTHVYVASEEVSWTSHDSDTSGPTGVGMI
ncbi:MAG: universal stress protein [Myxococcota bacterium]